MGKYLRISCYIRKPFLIYDFATAPLWISLYMRKIWFSFFIRADSSFFSTKAVQEGAMYRKSCKSETQTSIRLASLLPRAPNSLSGGREFESSVWTWTWHSDNIHNLTILQYVMVGGGISRIEGPWRSDIPVSLDSDIENSQVHVNPPKKPVWGGGG